MKNLLSVQHSEFPRSCFNDAPDIPLRVQVSADVHAQKAEAAL